MSTSLTPYDTGEILEPKVHSGTTGQVDFDNDESSTLITVSARPTAGQDGMTVTIDSHGDDKITVVVNDGAVINKTDSTDDAEPDDLSYAMLGRYAAALLGSRAGDWDSNEMTEGIARYAAELADFPALSGGSDAELKVWRDIADQLGIEHDGDEENADACRNPDCEDTTSNGEGYDGLCGNCADATTCPECADEKNREAALCADCTAVEINRS